MRCRREEGRPDGYRYAPFRTWNRTYSIRQLYSYRESITKQAWSQTFLLVLIEAAVVGITIGTGIIESLVDVALMGIMGI